MGEIEEFETELKDKTAIQVLEWCVEKFAPNVALSSSFGAEDVLLIDMLAKIKPNFTVFTLDTGRLPQETYNLMDKIVEKYDINLKVYFPDTKEVEEMVEEYGNNLFYKSIELRKLCCKVRKVNSLNRALRNLSAWITGLRREQSITRFNIKKIEIDKDHNNIYKINPLADWTYKKVWEYIEKNQVPYNELHNKNYPSIGCVPCTRAIKDGEDLRAGRWWWEPAEKRECGLHLKKYDKNDLSFDKLTDKHIKQGGTDAKS